MRDRHEVYETVFQLTASVLAIITNSVLFWLIKTKSPSSLGGYKYLMMYISLFETFYACFHLVFLPYILSSFTGFLVLLDPIVNLPVNVLQIFDYIFTANFGMANALFAIHFVFRYCVVSGNQTWTSTKPSIVAIWISIPIIVCILWVSACVAFLGQNEVSGWFIAFEMLTKENIAYVGPIFDFRLDLSYNLHVYWGLALLFVVGFSCFVTMVFFGIKCRFKLHALTKDTTQSATTKSLQNRLFSVLVAQSMIPFFLVFCPIAVLSISIFWGFGHEYFGKVLTMTNAIYPVLDPLPNLLMIKPYRQALMFWNRKASAKSPKVSNASAAANRRTSFLVTDVP